MGYPEDWFAALSPFPQILLAESAPVSLLDELRTYALTRKTRSAKREYRKNKRLLVTRSVKNR
jgi:hypothetical protein